MRTTSRIALTTVVAALVVALGGGIAWVVDRVGRDTAFSVERFERDVLVQPSGRLEVTERLDVRFTQARRGIFRDLPPDGPAGPVVYANSRVDTGSEDQPWPTVVETTPDGGTRLRIGDPAVLLSPGDRHYRLRYTIDGLTFRRGDDPDRVQVRLDVPGFAWPTDVGPTTLRLEAPGRVLDVTCVEGRRGTTRRCTNPPEIAGERTSVEVGPFRPGASATVAVEVDAAAFDVALPSFRPTELTRRSALAQLDVGPWAAGVALALLLLLPLAALEAVKAVVLYRDRVTDPALHDRLHPTAVPAPPFGFRPAEVAGLLLRPPSDAVFLATLVDLDQRGAVVSTHTGSDDDATVTFAPAPPGHAQAPVDAGFVGALLPGGAPARFDGTYDRDVAKRSGAATQVLHRRIRDVFRSNGFEHRDAGLLGSALGRAAAILAAFVCVGIVAALGTWFTPLPGGAVLAIAGVAVAGWAVTRFVWRHHRLPLNSAGRDAVAQARSFEEFLRTVEAEQLDWAAGQPGIDHHHPAVSLLPYAIALGHADAWFDRFGGIIRELTVAAGGAAIAGATWWATNSSFAAVQTARSGTVTNPSSSSGGSFGGGGGGSGGGGGGGGSW